jgi:hypothetical protein
MARPQPPIVQVALRYRALRSGDVVDIIGVFDADTTPPPGATNVVKCFLNHPGPYPGIKIIDSKRDEE